MHYNYSYNCMNTQIEMYVCAIKITRMYVYTVIITLIIVCLQNIKDSEKH